VAVTTRTESSLASGSVRTDLPEERKPRAVLFWAGLGVCFIAIEAVAVFRWIATGQDKSTPVGPSKVPTWMKWELNTFEAVGLVALVAFLYYFLIRPWRREGHITTDGLLCVVFFLFIPWQDTGLNYFQTWSTYNSYLINRGAWDTHILGWLSPHSNLTPEPLVWVVPIYLYCVLGGAILGCGVMRKAKARWPRMSPIGLVLTCLVFFVVWDAILEPIFLLMGIYTYPGAIPWLTIFHGHYYQYPVYEALMAGAWWTAFACARYFKDDKGQTLAERGIDRVRLKGGKRTGLRLLAFVGIMNSAFLVYNIPAAYMGLYAGPWPKDITSRSYLTDGACGPGTNFACSGPSVPIPRPESNRIGLHGGVVNSFGKAVP
jgi:hypothetical protein